MIPLGSKLTPPLGSQVKTKEQRRPTSKFFFSETGKDRALSFGLWHLFVSFIHMMPLRLKLAPPRGSQVGTIGTK